MHIKLSNLEIFLAQVIVWLALWLINDYLATLLTLIISAIVFSVLLIALISEAIERSKVPRRYFLIMAGAVAAPLVAALIYMVVFGGELNFLQKI